MSDKKIDVRELEQQMLETRQACDEIAAALEQLSDTLPEKTILILMAHLTGLPQKTIKLVWWGFRNISAEYFESE